MTPTEIPQAVKDKIEAYVKEKYPNNSLYALSKGDMIDLMQRGYGLTVLNPPYTFGPERTKHNQDGQKEKKNQHY